MVNLEDLRVGQLVWCPIYQSYGDPIMYIKPPHFSEKCHQIDEALCLVLKIESPNSITLGIPKKYGAKHNSDHLLSAYGVKVPEYICHQFSFCEYFTLSGISSTFD